MPHKLRSSAILLVILGIITRFIPHPPNLTAIGATSAFGGARLSRPWNYILPLFTLFVTDLFLGFHATMPYVYVSFILYVWIGERFLQNNPSLSRIGTAAIIGSLLFFLITNYGVWQSSTIYPPSVGGLVAAYVAGIPFLRNMLLGDLVLTISLFKAYKLLENQDAIRLFDNKVSNLVQY